MSNHLKKQHHCQLVYAGGKEWAVSDESGNKLELRYWCQPCDNDSSLSTAGADDGLNAEEAHLIGEQSSFIQPCLFTP